MQRPLLTLLVLLSTLTTIAFSQGAATSSVRGTVTDPKGAVIAGADVTLSNSETGFSRSTKTDGQGVYQFTDIPPATYTVSATAPGFATVKRPNVVLMVNSPATLNLAMSVQAEATTVEVTGAAPIVNTQDASLGHAFNSLQIRDLPSADRDPVSILSLQPGVVFFNKDATDTRNDSRNGAVNGARSDQTNVSYDGLDNNEQLLGSAFQGVLRATLDSLQEFRVTTSNANADAGRSSGAQVALVTKSGTNSFHGSLYEYHRPTFTSANDWFNKRAQLQAGLPNVPPKVLRNTFGGSFGGPIKKDRTFFFVSYEGFRSAETQQVTRIVPTVSMRQGQLRYICDSTDPNCTTGNPNVNITNVAGLGLVATLTPAQIASLDTACAGNQTCPLGPGPNPLLADINGGNPSALFNQYPIPNTTNVGDGLNTAGVTFAAPIPSHLNTYIVKLDHKLTANGNHSIFVRGNLQDDHFVPSSNCPPAAGSPCPQFPGYPASQQWSGNSKGLAVGYSALLRSNLVNNFKYGYVREGLNEMGLPQANVNFVEFRGMDQIFPFNVRSVLTNVPVHNLTNDTTWTKGKHTVQFGVNWRFIRNNRASNQQNYSFGYTNLYWMNPSFISGTGASLDPALGSSSGIPAVDPNFGTSYDFAAANLAGIISQVYSTYNQNKAGQLIPNGDLIQRHFKNFEGELYLQDSWRITPHLTITAGLRYSLLQPPYEANGEQVAPSVNMNQWFHNRGNAMLQGVTDQPDLTFDLSGQGNGRKPYWNWDYGDIAPRIAFAYSPEADSGLLHRLFGSAGKTAIRGGWGIYYDHFGMGVVNTFDRQGSYGLTTTLSNPAGTLSVDTAPRFAGINAVPPLLKAPAPHGFPYTPIGDPNTYGLAIAWGLNDHLKTPYSHVVDLSVQRELPKNFVVEAAYTGRFGRHLLQEIDLAEPLNLVDPKSGIDYFTAAQAFARMASAGVPASAVGPNAYWQDMFPAAAGPGLLSGSNDGSVPCSGGAAPANPTATQNMYDLFACNLGNETLALEIADAFCFPACAGPTGTTPFRYYQRQFSSLYAWDSIGTSNYNGLQLSLRHAMSNGIQFDINYVYSKSQDIGSNAERINGFESNGGVAFNDQVINTWRPRQWYSVSDFDLTHQFNANFVSQLPFGRGRKFGSGMNGVLNAILGGWGLSGIFRWTSGFPFSVFAGAGWATNFELSGSSILVGPKPRTGTFIDPATGDPQVFQDPQAIAGNFRPTAPGESGQRNNFRGPGYFEIDSGVGKSWNITERQNLEFRWETFNATNSVRFDAANSLTNEDLVDITSFGKYQSTLTKPRVMQFSLRYQF